MIKKLRLRFILLSMTSLFVLLFVIVVGMNVINYTSVVNQADDVLFLLSQNKGTFPNFDMGEHGTLKGDRFPEHMSPELPYESRYFSVLLTNGGEVIHTETSRIASVAPKEAEQYAKRVIESGNDRGFEYNFRYLMSSEGTTVRITFLDCQRQLDVYYTFLLASSGIALFGFLVVLLVMIFVSKRIIMPIAESYEKQRRFITDASHEIKTPLTIIAANADLLEMELGENDTVADIQQQTRRLTSLTNDLLLLARMDEAENKLAMIDFPISEIVSESASAFAPLAEANKKTFICEVQPMLSVRGNDRAVEQLVSILLSNALKYSDEGGSITLELTGQSRAVVLRVFNTTSMPVHKDKLERVFDRFYRMDDSRNSESGGHGIGLSIAKAIATAHGGKIQAWTQDGRIFGITVFFQY